MQATIKPEWLKPSIHPAYLRLLCAHLRNQGVDMDTLFKGNSLNWDSLLHTQRFISFEQFRRLCLNGMALTRCPWLGLEIPSMIQVSAHGPLGYGALAARTVRDAFQLVEQFLHTRILYCEFALEEHGDKAVFILHEQMDVAELKEFLYVMLLGSIQDMLVKTSAARLENVTVSLPFPEPVWGHLYAERFAGIAFCFDAPQCTIELPATLLDRHCLTGDEFAFRNAARECEQLLALHEGGGELSEQVKNRLFDGGAPFPSQTRMAENFNVSVRTLIRRLKAEHSSYQILLDEVRKELACWYLQNSDLPIERIAERLGFQDTSNFSRVFRRWLDCKPSEFRQH